MWIEIHLNETGDDMDDDNIAEEDEQSDWNKLIYLRWTLSDLSMLKGFLF